MPAKPAGFSAWFRRIPPVGWVFGVWTLVGAAVMAAGIDGGWVAGQGWPVELRNAALLVLGISDALWISLAAWLVLRHEAACHGPWRAGVALVLVAVPAAAAEWLGTTTGTLFGHYHYTDAFGWRLGGVLPFTIPLAWFIVVIGAARLAEAVGIINPWARALAVAVLATATDFNLEPVAIHVRGYWEWLDGPGGSPLAAPPWTNYATWFALAFVLAFAVPAGRPGQGQGRRAGLPAVPVLVLMNILFACAHAGAWARG
jgi:uncharacterized membrane protein